jgi:hypothetical protein
MVALTFAVGSRSVATKSPAVASSPNSSALARNRDVSPILSQALFMLLLIVRCETDREANAEEASDKPPCIIAINATFESPSITNGLPKLLAQIGQRYRACRRGLVEKILLSGRLRHDLSGKADRAAIMKVQIEQASSEQGT